MASPPLVRRSRASSYLLLLPIILLLSASPPPFAQALTSVYLDDPTNSVSMEYEIVDDTLRATVTFSDAEGWVGLGFPEEGKDGMIGADAVVGFPGTGEVVKYDLTSWSEQSRMSDDRQTLTDASISRGGDGTTVMTFTKVLQEEGENPIAPSGPQNFIWARGSSDTFAYHAAKGKALVELVAGAAPPDEEEEVSPPTDGEDSSPPDGESSSPDLAVGDEVCVEGYVMDQFCINLGVLLDMQSVVTLEGPDQHTVHCLVDVPRCINSGYEILIDPIVEGRTTYCRGYLLNDEGNRRVLEVARSVGVCDECSDGGTLERGFRASVRGTVTDLGDGATPAGIDVTDLVHAGDGNSSDMCGANATKIPPSGRACVDPGLTPPPVAPTPAPAESTPAPTFPVEEGGARAVFLDPPANRVSMRYEVVDSGGRAALRATVAYGGLGWVGVGFPREGEDGMAGADAVVGLPNTNEVVKYDLHSYQEQTRMPDDRQTLVDTSIEQTDDGTTVMTFTKFLVEEGENPITSDASQNFIAAYGSSNTFGYHSGRGKAQLNLESGGVEAIVDPNKKKWKAHGIVAAVGWGFLTPLAVASSWLRDLYPPGPTWFRVHQAFNGLTWILTVAAFAVAVQVYQSSGRVHFDDKHPRMGLAIFVLVFLQALGGAMRPHLPPQPQEDEKDEVGGGESAAQNEEEGGGNKSGAAAPPAEKSKVRIIWEVLHKSTGLALLGCSFWQIDKGLQLYGALYPTSGALTTGRRAFWGWIGAWGALVVLGLVYTKILKKK